jgi:Xaa-Pro aminopeptidase
MSKKTLLSTSNITENIQKWQKFMQTEQLDGFYISSNDIYLNEYVPLSDCHRYYVTGFTGSTAEVLLPQTGKVRLYVDGRYHEQADLEVDPNLVEVVKVKSDIGIGAQLLLDIKSMNLKRVGYEGDRTSLSYLKSLEAVTSSKGFFNHELHQVISFLPALELKKVEYIAREHRGRDTLVKTKLILEKNQEAFYLTALDSIAWVTNARGFQLPNLSSFKAKALCTRDKVWIYVPTGTPISDKLLKEPGLHWMILDFNNLPKELKKLQTDQLLSKIYFDPAMINAGDYKMLIDIFGLERLEEKKSGIVGIQSIKEPVEMEEMRRGFKRADKAIHKTIKWVKESIQSGKRMTELDLYHQTDKHYQEMGSVEQSFKTIAGVGANSSIIHYSSPSDQVTIDANHMVLLDSGGYFEGGFATDTTRTFLASDTGTPDPKCVEIYTLVLKGLLQAQNAVFPEGTKGNVIDGLTRQPLFKSGYNFSHGTGHGVGIHVHEDGVRISPLSTLPMKVGQVVSIEPGIYIPNFGGVRLENIVHVIPHPKIQSMLCFEPLVYIGFDPRLINFSLLNSDEKKWYDEYEAVCRDRGTSLSV